MATYLMLLNWTDQGIRNVKESPKRLDAVKKTAKDMGGEVKAFYMLQGSYDLALIVEMPHDEKLAAFCPQGWFSRECSDHDSQSVFRRRIPEDYRRSWLNSRSLVGPVERPMSHLDCPS